MFRSYIAASVLLCAAVVSLVLMLAGLAYWKDGDSVNAGWMLVVVASAPVFGVTASLGLWIALVTAPRAKHCADHGAEVLQAWQEAHDGGHAGHIQRERPR